MHGNASGHEFTAQMSTELPVLHLRSGTCVMSSKNASKHDHTRATTPHCCGWKL